MESYNDYYYYKLTNYDKINMGIFASSINVEYGLDYVFVHNTYTFKETIDYIKKRIDSLDETAAYGIIYPLIFFGEKIEFTKDRYKEGYIDINIYISTKNHDKFTFDYGKLFRVMFKPYGGNVMYGSKKIKEEIISENDRKVLYSKIPSYVEGMKCIRTIFYIRKICEWDLPEDVIKHMLQFIIKN
jgi:hypothetical protein